MHFQYRCAIIVRRSGNAPLAQLDRVSGYGPEGRGFESLKACQNKRSSRQGGPFCFGIPEGIRTRGLLARRRGRLATRGGLPRRAGRIPQGVPNVKLLHRQVGELCIWNSFSWDSNPRALGKAPGAPCNPGWPAPQVRSNPTLPHLPAAAGAMACLLAARLRQLRPPCFRPRRRQAAIPSRRDKKPRVSSETWGVRHDLG